MDAQTPRDVEPALQLFYDQLKVTPIGIVLADLEGRLLFANQALCSTLGFSEAEMRSKHWIELSPPEDAAKDWALFGRLRAGSAYHFHLDKRCFRSDASVFLGHWSVWLLGSQESPLVFAMVTDKGQADLASHESEEHFRKLADTVPVMIWMSGTDGFATYCNQRCLDFAGRSLQEQIGTGWAAGLHPEDRQQCLETYTHAFDRREPFRMEYRLRRHDGEYRWVLGSAVPRFNLDNSFAGYVGSAIDITERKHAEEALSSMSRKLIEAQEQERSYVARELHDDVNQRLAVLSVNLHTLRQELPASAADIGKRISEACDLVSELGSDIQALSHRLHSSKLAYLGLEGAAASFCRELSDHHRMAVDFRAEGIPKELPQDVALCLFRVLQEALQNAAKHSGAKHFQVALGRESDEIHLMVRDQGIGFNVEDAVNNRGMGLISMRERLKLVDGDLSIESRLQVGTAIHARVPLAPRVKGAST